MSHKLWIWLFVAFLSSFSVSVSVATLTVPIDGKLVIPDGTVPGNYEITLNGGLFSTMTRYDGRFTFHEIPTGIYLLDVQSIKEMFPQMKIKVSAEDGSITVVEYKYHGAKRMPSSYPLVITAIAQMEYFQMRPPFSLVGALMGNPMLLVMLFSAVMVVGMPKLMAGMSPEDLEELKKQSAGGAGGGDPMKQLSKLMGGASATANDEDDD